MYLSDDELRLYTTESNARAVELIARAEEMFGPATSKWRYEGVIFQDHPPHLYYWPESGLIQISLSFKAVRDNVQRDFQLAHEVCHLLYPSMDVGNPGKPETNVINEGISTYFSMLIIGDYGEDVVNAAISSLASHSSRYLFALKEVIALLQTDKDAVKKIRQIQPMINEVTESELRVSGISLSDEAFVSLAEKF